MITPKVLEDLILDRLRITMSHVRGNTTWIYPDQPRTDAKKPRMAVELGSMPNAPSEIDEGLRRQTASLSVDIYTDTVFIYSFEGERYNGTLLRDHLWGLVTMELTQSSKSTLWVSAGLTDVREVGGQPFPYIEQDDIYHRQIRYSLELFKA